MLHGCPRAAATSHPAVDRDHFQLGSLSHLLNAKAVGYQELPDWPDEAPDPSVRNVEVCRAPWCAGVHGGAKVGASSRGRGRAPEGAQVLLSCPMSPLWCPHTRLGTGAGEGCCLGPPPVGNGHVPSALCPQVPEWTKCTSREKRKEKVEKPFYSDSEGESGPTESADSGEYPVAQQGMGQGPQWWGNWAGVSVAGTSGSCHHGGAWVRNRHDGASGKCHHSGAWDK